MDRKLVSAPGHKLFLCPFLWAIQGLKLVKDSLYKKTASFEYGFETHWLSRRNENDGGWDTFMENAEVLQVTLFTPV